MDSDDDWHCNCQVHQKAAPVSDERVEQSKAESYEVARSYQQAVKNHMFVSNGHQARPELVCPAGSSPTYDPQLQSTVLAMTMIRMRGRFSAPRTTQSQVSATVLSTRSTVKKLEAGPDDVFEISPGLGSSARMASIVRFSMLSTFRVRLHRRSLCHPSGVTPSRRGW